MAQELEVVYGPMFSGKSGVLMQRLAAAGWAEVGALVIKPVIDDRFDVNEIQSRELREGKPVVVASQPAIPIRNMTEFRHAVAAAEGIHMLVVDEAQFFGDWLIQEIQELLDEPPVDDFQIIVAGLDLTATREPFGPILALRAMADTPTKCSGVCMRCKRLDRPGCFTMKVGGSRKKVEIGDIDIYEVRCRSCWGKE